MAYSDDGLGALSDAFHGLYRERLARGTWRDAPRPVLHQQLGGDLLRLRQPKLVEIAASARDLGVELFVLDDGWFGQRDSDDSSLGDWFVDRRKLPDGLDGVARRSPRWASSFGLWIEPEMVSARSGLFGAHPDWAIGIPGRPRTESRQQLVLDMSRPEVVDHLIGVLAEVLASAPISYIKWDMNRNITEPYSLGLPADRQGEFFHRYILGVYDLYARLTTAFPDVLFESCAGGGGRFDPGMLAFAPQAWTSDDTDAVERLRDPVGHVAGYPLSSMAAHVSAVPNHQTGRITPLATRAAVAFFGVFGYELDPTALSDAERAEIAARSPSTLHRETVPARRFVRLAARSRGAATRRPGWSSRGRSRPSSAATGSSAARRRRPSACGCAASIRRRPTGSPAGRIATTALRGPTRRARRRRTDARRAVARRRPKRGRRLGRLRRAWLFVLEAV